NGYRPLGRAAWLESPAAVKTLLCARASPNLPGNANGVALLMYAIYKGSPAAVLALLKAGANPGFLDGDGHSSLHLAA
ncbi:hypothetical protein BOTBODRAFT_72584, partial [Botryobasidium botryosum FD-172 SS1]